MIEELSACLSKFLQDDDARAVCQEWNSTISESLQISWKVSLGKHLAKRDGVAEYHHMTSLNRGGDFYETRTYNFRFFKGRRFEMQFFKFSSESEATRGKWHVE